MAPRGLAGYLHVILSLAHHRFDHAHLRAPMLRRRFLLPSLGLTTALALACSTGSPTTPADLAAELRVVLPAASFTRAPSGPASVPFAVENGGPQAVGVLQCGAQVNPVIERWQDGEWVGYAGGVCLAIYPIQLVALEPGGRRTGATAIGAVGRYRLVVRAEGGEVASAPFDVQ